MDAAKSRTFAGLTAHGGGGGAGGPATDNDSISPGTPGSGGPGRACDITGSTLYYGGGAAGWRDSTAIARCSGGIGGGGNGCAGTDGLGGGGCAYDGSTGGFKGGSGVVIVRLRKPTSGCKEVIDRKAEGGVRKGLGHGVQVHTFTADGTFTMPQDGYVEVLLVGGGGGAGLYTTYDGRGGTGGGGGGVVHKTAFPLVAGTYPVTVGLGGKGGGRITVDTKGSGAAANGGDSTFAGLTAFGGGGGGHYGQNVGASGATGGGSSSSWQSRSSGGLAIHGDQGCAGGDADSCYHPGGGGGAGAPGVMNTTSAGGHGGDGLAFDITGASLYYGGGGAGIRHQAGATSKAGLGGGGHDSKGTNGLGGGGSGGYDGGSGVVIIRYASVPPGLLIIGR